jgi:hypothetical protein
VSYVLTRYNLYGVFSCAEVIDSNSSCSRNFVISPIPSDNTEPLTDSALPPTDTRPGNIYFPDSSPKRQSQHKQRSRGTYSNTRCRPPRGSKQTCGNWPQSFFPSRDRSIHAPLVHGSPSHSFSTMSHPSPTPAAEPVSPGVRKVDTASIYFPVVSPRTYDEPVVTRKKLWSYYRKSRSFPVYHNTCLLSCSPLG